MYPFPKLNQKPPTHTKKRIPASSKSNCHRITLHSPWENLDEKLGIPDSVASRNRPDGRDVKTPKPRQSRNPLHWKMIAATILAFTLPSLLGHVSAQESVRVHWNPNPEPDIAGYTVYLGTSSGNYATSQTVISNTSAIVSGLVPSTTYFCAVQAYNTAGLKSTLSDEVSFTTVSATQLLFQNWATSGGLNGSASAPHAIPFNDGVPNLLKYAFNMTATGPDVHVVARGTGTTGLPAFAVEQSGSGALFTVEFLRRKNSGLTYTPRVSTDLVHFEPLIGAATVTSINAEWERVVLRRPIDKASAPKLFADLEVSLQ